MSNYSEERKQELAREQEALQRANELARVLNTLDLQKAAKEQQARSAATEARQEAEFKAYVRTLYPALDDATFATEWPRLRVKALEEESAAILAKKRADYIGFI